MKDLISRLFFRARFHWRYVSSYIRHRFLSHAPPIPSRLREICPRADEIGMLTQAETAFSADLTHWAIETPDDDSLMAEIDQLLHRANSPNLRNLGACSSIAILYQNELISPACVVDLYAWQFREPRRASDWLAQMHATASEKITKLADHAFVVRTSTYRTVCFCVGHFGVKATFLHEHPDELRLIEAVTSRIHIQCEL